MASKDSPVLIDDCSGGQNAAMPPHMVAKNQCAAAVNVEWFRGSVARKRRGSRLVERDAGSALPTTKKFSTIAGSYRTADTDIALVVEAADLSEWYRWGEGSWDFTPFTPIDTQATNACVVFFGSRIVAAYKSSVDRLHWLDVPPGFRVGFAPPATPTIVETAGAVTDNRKYRAAFIATSADGGRSEPSTETAVKTLIGERATATAPGANPGLEIYNQWELQVASDDDNYATWWVVGQAALISDIVDNNASLLNLEVAPQLGLFEPPHSAKFLMVDDNRLLLAGAHESTDEIMQQRVWFTPVLGDMDEGDDARIPNSTTQRNWVDLNAGDDGGAITGFAPATLGDVLVFKRTQLWRMTRTGNIDAPYIPRLIDPVYGTFGYRTVCAGQDAAGGPCVYFASARGPVRFGLNGPEYLGAAIEDVWATVNTHGNVYTSQHGVYYADRGQYWLWVSTNAATVPDTLLIFTVATGGWARYTGAIAAALSSALLPRYVTEPNKGVSLTISLVAPRVPYCCPNTNGQIVECDAINPSTGVALDTDLETYSGSAGVWSDGTPYQAYVTTTPIPPKTLDGFMTVQDVTVEADAAAGVTLSVSLVRDHGAETRTFSTSLAADGTETRVIRRVEGAATAGARAVAVTLGDASAVASQWNLLRAQLRVLPEAQP